MGTLANRFFGKTLPLSILHQTGNIARKHQGLTKALQGINFGKPLPLSILHQAGNNARKYQGLTKALQGINFGKPRKSKMSSN
jgi:hypothetical protein